MEMSPGEICDRYTILRMKSELDDALLPSAVDYGETVLGFVKKHPWIVSWLLELMEANAKIWMLESDIRNHKKMTLAEVGRRAILIRDHNARRVAAKEAIDKAFGAVPDRKFDHISAK